MQAGLRHILWCVSVCCHGVRVAQALTGGTVDVLFFIYCSIVSLIISSVNIRQPLLFYQVNKHLESVR